MSASCHSAWVEQNTQGLSWQLSFRIKHHTYNYSIKTENLVRIVPWQCILFPSLVLYFYWQHKYELRLFYMNILTVHTQFFQCAEQSVLPFRQPTWELQQQYITSYSSNKAIQGHRIHLCNKWQTPEPGKPRTWVCYNWQTASASLFITAMLHIKSHLETLSKSQDNQASTLNIKIYVVILQKNMVL